ncbi:hypothetical protein GCM10011415_28230 [Salipiger pallidus]|uniref:Chromosomal replication initiator DnaA C-terminal domain-containing protein n=1 Tax=Salipiger pallidus TaxID=1775170 RepID=A0A8J3EHW1_9RHOB|nr:helix-turn-helix domain-containing protein [Salipiger pallidus]GGG77673.1 hypothetical protein GCM10011415_28230 [Salipiger pallidus]
MSGSDASEDWADMLRRQSRERQAKMAELLGGALDIDGTQIFPEPPDPRDDIVAVVAAHHGVSLEDMRSHSRKPALVRARHEAFWAMRQAGFSGESIGEFMRRHFSTVMYGAAREAERRAGQEGEAAPQVCDLVTAATAFVLQRGGLPQSGPAVAGMLRAFEGAEADLAAPVRAVVDAYSDRDVPAFDQARDALSLQLARHWAAIVSMQGGV